MCRFCNLKNNYGILLKKLKYEALFKENMTFEAYRAWRKFLIQHAGKKRIQEIAILK